MPQTFVLPRQVAVLEGVVAPFAVARFYQTNTTTPQSVYNDAALSNAVTSITADSAGIFSKVYLNPNAAANYRIRVENAVGAQIYQEDDIDRLPASQAAIGAALYPRTTAESAANVTPTNYAYPPGDVRRYGCAANDGTTDESAQLQNAVDANKGSGIWIPCGHTVVAAGILLSGSTYNRTTIRIDGTFKFKAAPTAGTNNFQSAVWAGIIVHNCDGVTVEVIGIIDGNSTNQPDNTHMHCLVLAGVTNFTCPVCNVKEIRGDGIYIGQATLTSNSTNSSNVHFGYIQGRNSADDGRNLLSIISCDRLTIERLDSYQIGGTVVSALMPGGLDIEPDFGYQSCTDIEIGIVRVVTAGTSGFNLFGKAITNDATRDWCIQRVRFADVQVTRTGTSGSGISGAAIIRARDIRGNASMRYATTKGACWSIDYADRIFVRLDADNTTNAIALGGGDDVRDSAIDGYVTRYSFAGFRTCKLTDVTLRGRCFDSLSVSGSTPFAIHCHDEGRGSIQQTNVIYEVDAPYDGVNIRAMRNEPGNLVTYSGCVARDCDWSGYSAFNVQCDALIPTEGISGRNTRFATAIPGVGTFVVGDRVYNADPTAGEAASWLRLTSGTSHTLNTDWAISGQVGYRTNAGAPSVNANFIGERFFDTTNTNWYTAVASGGGAADWKKDSP